METQFDYIILGTGLKNAILSAGLAQRKKTIYHIDSKPNYGSYWISLTFEEILQMENNPHTYTNECFSNFEFVNNLYFETQTNNNKNNSDNNNSNNNNNSDNNNSNNNNGPTDENLISNGAAENIIAQQKCTQQPETLTLGDMKRLSNKFKFDFLPKIFKNNCTTIKLVVDSQIHHYLEFMVHGKNFMGHVDSNENLLMIPFTRGDVFKNDRMNPLEKRSFVRFVTKCLQLYSDISNNLQVTQDENGAIEDELKLDLGELFRNAKLPNNLLNVLSHDYIIEDCLSNENVGGLKGVDFVRRLGSLTEALYTFNTKSTHVCLRYGVSELPQAFCRVSAVYGTVFRLNVADNFSVSYEPHNEAKFTLNIDGDIIRSQNLIAEPQYLKHIVGGPTLNSKSSTKKLMRAILVTTKSLFDHKPTDDEQSSASSIMTLLEKSINETNNRVDTVALEMGTKLMVTPMNLKMVHLFKWSHETSAKESFHTVISNYFSMEREVGASVKPTILYGFYFVQNVFDTDSNCKLSPLITTSFPHSSLNVDNELTEIVNLMEQIDPQTPLLLPRNIPDNQ